MDLKKIMEDLKSEESGFSEFGMNNLEEFSRNTNIAIKKEKFELDSSALYLIPLQLKFPFNPFNLGDKRFNKKNYYISPYSCSSTLFSIKAEMRKNPMLKEFFCRRADVDPNTYDLNTLVEGKDRVTDDDWKVFGLYRGILHYYAYVQKLSYSSCGKFGTKILSNVKMNEAGVVVGEKDLGYKIHEFEQSLVAERVNQVYKSYEEGGPKFGQPDTDRSKEVKQVWKEKPISEPYKLGAIRYVKLKSDRDFELDPDLKKDLIKEPGKILGYSEVYGSGNHREATRFESYLGRKTDIYFDFLEIGIWYPNPDVDEQSKILESYSRRDMNANPVQRIKSVLPKIEDWYRDFRDDTDRFCEAVMLRSVRDWKQWDDSLLLQAVKEDLGSKKAYITNETLKLYGKLMKQIDGTLTMSLMEESMQGLIGETSGQPVSLEGMITPDETMKGYGISIDDNESVDLDYNLDDVEEIVDSVNLEE